MYRFVRTALALTIVVGTLGCRDGAGPRSVVVTYALESMDGAPLPIVIQTTPLHVELVEHRLTLYDDGNFEERTVYLDGPETSAKIRTVMADGTWEGTRSRFQLHHEVQEFFWNMVTCAPAGETVSCTNGLLGSSVWLYREVVPVQT